MKDIRIRELTRSDMKKIGDLLGTRAELNQERAEKRKQLLEWIAFCNPDAVGETTYFVAEDSEKLIGYIGRMPTEFVIKGKRQKGYFMHDLYVHPEYRKKGLGFFISMALYRKLEQNTDSFLCGLWPSPLNLKLQRQRGYHELHGDRFIKILSPRALLLVTKKESFVRMVDPILRIVLRLVDLILIRQNSLKVRVAEVERFDARFDELSQKVLRQTSNSPFKKSSYLNWKYIDRPYRRNTVLAAEQNGQILGFAVLAVRSQKGYPKGTILDLMSDPDDTKSTSSLCAAAINYFKKQKVYSIHSYLTDKRFAKVFKRFLFIKVFSSDTVLLANLEKCQEERENLTCIDNWHLSYGDSDGFMLRP